jgi:Ca-activated chloride channel homolog
MMIPAGPLDRRAMKSKIAALSPKGKTPLSEAVKQAAQALRYTEEKATVILGLCPDGTAQISPG